MRLLVSACLCVALCGCTPEPQGPPSADPNAAIKERVRRAGEEMAEEKKNAKPSPAPAIGTPKVKLLGHRIGPFTTAQGQAAQMVYIDWKNVGSGAINSVSADIVAYDAAGNELGSSARNYTVWVAEGKPPVNPGQTMKEPKDAGYILIPFYGKADKVEVRITRYD